MIEKILNERIMILDGPMGTMIQEHSLDENDFRGKRFVNHKEPLKGNNDLLNITKPDLIKTIHRSYLEAGADIIETNTFNSTSISLADYGMEKYAYDFNHAGAKIAKEAKDEFCNKTKDSEIFVAGSIGPTNRTASLSPDVNDPAYRTVSFDNLVYCYSEQILGLIDGGVDILFVETIFDTLNAKAALFAIDKIKSEKKLDIPVMVSGTITDASGRTLSGQTVEAFVISISHIPLLSIGFNCALGADQLLPYVKRLSKITDTYTSVHPNAGLPNAFGAYDQTATEMSDLIENYLKENIINIVGGCCGTKPEHIRLIAEVARNYKPRKI
ncbi:MAG: 5-methyltetrahydrofolate--homocysteine methyltransferase [Flavobacteriaceae bacterium]|nr:5-methyltetrahydrofolate--homocysteine methyltransferase [Flavobacteriaceae bacterium]|tara:strand:+ start:1674 stop:2657 length:984 start_codon:yes stop_codon:yes gene_type:complete